MRSEINISDDPITHAVTSKIRYTTVYVDTGRYTTSSRKDGLAHLHCFESNLLFWPEFILTDQMFFLAVILNKLKSKKDERQNATH